MTQEEYVQKITEIKSTYTKNLSTLLGNVFSWYGGVDVNKGQHWSGDTNKEYLDFWNGNAWSQSKKNTLFLPKGKYVFMAAGRSSAGATAYLKVDNVSVNFPNGGDSGYGITTKGVPSFDESGEYANDDKGRGWQWRAIEFTVENDNTPVSLEVGGTATGNNWMSISDVSLYSEDVAEVSFEDYNVSSYNRVKDSYKVDVTNLLGDVSTWDGNMIANNGDQHWSGAKSYAYWEQTGAMYGQAGWTVNKTKKVKLPKGKYAFIASGRAMLSTFPYMRVDDRYVVFPAKGSDSKGIDKSGKANFGDGDFANDGKGRGWEWRTCEFEVPEDDTEVTIEIGGFTKVKNQWLSITDVSLVTTSANALKFLTDEITEAKSLEDEIMNKDVLATLQSTIASLENLSESSSVEEITDGRNSLKSEVEKAKASIDQYKALKAELDKAANFDEAGKAKFNELAKDVAESYVNRTYAGDFAFAKTTIDNALAEGAKAQTTAGSDMTLAVSDHACTDVKTWKISAIAANNNYQYDTWSGNASGMSVNFLEYWLGANAGNLADATISQTIEGLHPGLYQVKMEVAVNNEKTKEMPTGVYFNANNSSVELKDKDTTPHNGTTGVFELKAVVGDDHQLTIGFNTKNATANWLAFKNCKLTYLRALKVEDFPELATAKETASAINTTANVGDKAFQIPTAIAEGVTSAINKANALTDENVTTTGVDEAVKDLNASVDAFKNAELNKPAEGDKFNIIINGNANYQLNGNAVSFNDGNPTAGGYAIGYIAKAGAYYNQALTLIPTDKVNEYYLSFFEADGTQKYVGTGANYSGGTNEQLRVVDSQDKAVAVKIEATSTQDIYNLKNVVANKYIAANNEKDAGFFTSGKQWRNFNLVAAAKNSATIKVTDAKWATFIAPFDTELPNGVTAYTCDHVDDASATLTLTEVTGGLKANVPYLLYADAPVTETVEGYALATKATYANGLLTGVYEKTAVAKDARNYALQNHEGVVGYYAVKSDDIQCAPNRAYFTAPEATSAKVFTFDTADVTGIGAVKSLLGDAKEVARYDASGRKVNAPVKGLNIIKLSDGKILKVIIK